ncbi:MAG: hypothetical protein WCP20_24370 [Desulfuromonadales bacterium]|jgi:hypothetical protein
MKKVVVACKPGVKSKASSKKSETATQKAAASFMIPVEDLSARSAVKVRTASGNMLDILEKAGVKKHVKVIISPSTGTDRIMRVTLTGVAKTIREDLKAVKKKVAVKGKVSAQS